MNTKTKEILKTLVPEEETLNSINELLELENVKFNAIKDELIETIKQALNDSTFDKNEIKKALLHDNSTPEQNREAVNNTISIIDEDDDLSPAKKEFLKTIIESSYKLVCVVADNPRQIVKVKVIRTSPDTVLPTYAHTSDAGADIYTIKDEHIPPHKTQIIDTGLQVDIPKGYEIQIRPRSGMSLKTKLRIANSVATIDPLYHDNVGIIIDNISSKAIDIPKGTKIAQMLIKEIPMIEWEEVNSFTSEDRGGGFGSTDKTDDDTE